jgi:hypothetical protein
MRSPSPRRGISKHKSFYHSEFRPAERKALAKAAASLTASPDLTAAGPGAVRPGAAAALLTGSALLPVPISSEVARLPAPPNAPLADEIDLNKVTILRMLAISREQPPEDAVRTLALISAVNSRLVNVIRIQQLMLNDMRQRSYMGGNGDLLIMLENVLLEVQQELNVPKL